MSDDLIKRQIERMKELYGNNGWSAALNMEFQLSRATDRAEAAEKACAEWAETSQANYQWAKAAEARIATIERETLERAAVVAEEVASGKCTKCGSPRNNHPHRHPFIGLTTGDIPTAIRAMIEEKTDE